MAHLERRASHCCHETAPPPRLVLRARRAQGTPGDKKPRLLQLDVQVDPERVHLQDGAAGDVQVALRQRRRGHRALQPPVRPHRPVGALLNVQPLHVPGRQGGFYGVSRGLLSLFLVQRMLNRTLSAFYK